MRAPLFGGTSAAELPVELLRFTVRGAPAVEHGGVPAAEAPPWLRLPEREGPSARRAAQPIAEESKEMVFARGGCGGT